MAKYGNNPGNRGAYSRGSDDGTYEGVLGTKSPSDAPRPVPKVARNDPAHIMAHNIASASPVKVPTEHTPMPRTLAKRGSGRPKNQGGDSY